jgi:hypothetical protein
MTLCTNTKKNKESSPWISGGKHVVHAELMSALGYDACRRFQFKNGLQSFKHGDFSDQNLSRAGGHPWPWRHSSAHLPTSIFWRVAAQLRSTSLPPPLHSRTFSRENWEWQEFTSPGGASIERRPKVCRGKALCEIWGSFNRHTGSKGLQQVMSRGFNMSIQFRKYSPFRQQKWLRGCDSPPGQKHLYLITLFFAAR